MVVLYLANQIKHLKTKKMSKKITYNTFNYLPIIIMTDFENNKDDQWNHEKYIDQLTTDQKIDQLTTQLKNLTAILERFSTKEDLTNALKSIVTNQYEYTKKMLSNQGKIADWLQMILFLHRDSSRTRTHERHNKTVDILDSIQRS